jgi:hypothetical protein
LRLNRLLQSVKFAGWGAAVEDDVAPGLLDAGDAVGVVAEPWPETVAVQLASSSIATATAATRQDDSGRRKFRRAGTRCTLPARHATCPGLSGEPDPLVVDDQSE